jgi:hypothetical protein
MNLKAATESAKVGLLKLDGTELRSLRLTSYVFADFFKLFLEHILINLLTLQLSLYKWYVLLLEHLEDLDVLWLVWHFPVVARFLHAHLRLSISLHNFLDVHA